MLKVAACRVKPYDVIPRDKDKLDADDKKCKNEEEN